MVALHLWQHLRLFVRKLTFIASRAHRLRLDQLFLHGPEAARLMHAAARTTELRSAKAVNCRGGDGLAEKRGGPHRCTLTATAIHRLILEQSWFSFK